MNSGLIYFSLFFFLSVFQLMGVSINGSYISRTFYEMPPTIVKSAIYPLDDSGSYSPHFKNSKVKECVIEYLDKNLESKIDKYKIGFVFLKKRGAFFSIDYTGKATAVDIKISCKYCQIFDFTGSVRFLAEGVYENGWEPNWIYWK